MLILLLVLSISFFVPSILSFKIFLVFILRVMPHISFWGSLWDLPWTWRFLFQAFFSYLIFRSFFF